MFWRRSGRKLSASVICQSSSASDTKMKVSGTVTVHLHMGESHRHVNLRVVNELDFTVLLEAMFIDRFIKSIHPVERKIITHQSPPVPIFNGRRGQ